MINGMPYCTESNIYFGATYTEKVEIHRVQYKGTGWFMEMVVRDIDGDLTILRTMYQPGSEFQRDYQVTEDTFRRALATGVLDD